MSFMSQRENFWTLKIVGKVKASDLQEAWAELMSSRSLDTLVPRLWKLHVADLQGASQQSRYSVCAFLLTLPGLAKYQ